MSKRTFTQLAFTLLFVLALPRGAAAQLGEEVRERDRSEAADERDQTLEHHRAEMERHRAEMERHARAMREALMRAHGDSGDTHWRYRTPDARYLYSARVRQPCARMGIAFTGDDTITVDEVMEGSGAAEAGVREGDVIVSINGERADVRTMIELAEGLEADDRVRLVVLRDGREQTLDVTAQEDVCPLRTMLSPEPFHVTCMKRDSSDVDADEDCAHEFVFRLRESFDGMHERLPLRVFTEQGDSGTWLHFEGPEGERSLFINLDSMRLMADEFSFQLDSLREMMPFTVHMADSLRMLMPKIEMDMREAEEAMHAHGLMVRSLELGARALAGAHLTELNEDLAAYFEADDGVLVTRVEDETPAARAGLSGGDVIVEVNGVDVDDMDDVREHAASADGPLELTILRRGERRTVRIND